jgi:predicted KAP-like P-loop ATPase
LERRPSPGGNKHYALGVSITSSEEKRRGRRRTAWRVVFIFIAAAIMALLITDLLTRPDTRNVTLGVLFTIAPFAEAGIFVGLYLLAQKISPSPPSRAARSTPDPRATFTDASHDLHGDDEFRRLDFAVWFAEILERMHREPSSSVIGLVGRWGSGKSSILDTVEVELRRLDSNWRIARLNPWRYVTAEAMISGFFGELRAAFPSDRRWSDARAALAGLLETAAGFGSLTSAFGFDASGALRASARAARGNNSATRAEQTARAALEELAQPILVIIDDVDRLEPAELARLFQMVRAIGRLPYVHYLLAYDELTVLDNLSRSGLVGTRSRAAEFMEKIVQVRFDVPPLRAKQAEPAIDRRLEELMSKFDVQVTQSDPRQARFARIFQEFLARRLRTPRSILRWIEHVRLFYPVAKQAEVDFFDFVLVVWLRITYPDVAQMLQDHRADIFREGFSALLNKDVAAHQDQWLRWLKAAGVRSQERDEMYRFLGQLFPTIEDDRVKATSSTRLDEVRRRLGVGHPQYFDRYFGQGVPEEQLSETDFFALVTAIADTAGPAHAFARFEAILRRSAPDVVERLEDYLKQNPGQTVAILRLLFSAVTGADDTGLFSSKDAIRGVIYRTLRDNTDRLGVIYALSNYPEIRVAVLDALTLLARNPGLDEQGASEVRRIALGNVPSLLEDSNPSREIRLWSDATWIVLWDWYYLEPEELRTWYRRAAELDGDLVDALAALVSKRRRLGDPDTEWKLGPLPNDSVEAFLGFDWVSEQLRMTRLPEEEMQIDGDWDLDFGSVADTWENRRAIARGWIDRFDKVEPPTGND